MTDGGTVRLRGDPLLPHASSLGALLEGSARRAPENAFIVERDARGVWRTLTFAHARERACRVAAALRALGASARRPVMILGENGIDHALLALGAWTAGVPIVPIPRAVAVHPLDGFARLREIARIVRPAIVFARDGAAHAPAVRAALGGARYVTVTEPPPGIAALDFARLLAHDPLDDIDAGGETVAKIAFPQRPGAPLGVATSHAMMCAMLQALAQAWPFLAETPPAIVDSVPWSHGLGGTVAFGIALRYAGTLYIGDDQVSPTLAFDVPLGWAARTQRLRADDALRRRWLAQLQRAVWSGATLAPRTRDALRAIGVPLAGAWGTAETTAIATLTHGIDPPHDGIGAPLPGVELKLVPAGSAFELRVGGPQVSDGYVWRPDATAAAFDDEGFYRTGDLVRALDARRPARGLAFAGRTDARFKLPSGEWVDGVALRAAFLRACPDALDAIVVGENAERVGILVWPRSDGTIDAALLRAQIADALRAVAPASRALVAANPVERRAADVVRLNASEPDAQIILAAR